MRSVGLSGGFRRAVVGVLAAAGGLVTATSAAGIQSADDGAGDIFVANLQTGAVTRFDGATGVARGKFVRSGAGGLAGATGLTFGPDGHLYVSSSQTGQVLRFDGKSGEFLDVFVQADSARLGAPFSLIFGPDGDLFVSSGNRHRVVRYDGRTGEWRGAATRDTALGTPIGLAFDSDGVLFVANAQGKNVSYYDPGSGERLGVIGDSLGFVSDIVFDADGFLYASEASKGRVVRIDTDRGESQVYVQLPEGSVPVGVAFDLTGRLLVGDFVNGRLYRSSGAGEPPELLSSEGLARPENLIVKGAARSPVRPR